MPIAMPVNREDTKGTKGFRTMISLRVLRDFVVGRHPKGRPMYDTVG